MNKKSTTISIAVALFIVLIVSVYSHYNNPEPIEIGAEYAYLDESGGFPKVLYVRPVNIVNGRVHYELHQVMSGGGFYEDTNKVKRSFDASVFAFNFLFDKMK